MRFEKFEVRSKSGIPTVTITPTGRFSFNEAARQRFRMDSRPFVDLFYARDERVIGFRLYTELTQGSAAMKLRLGRRSGAVVSAKVFLDYYGIEYGQSVRIPLEMDPENKLLLARLPDGASTATAEKAESRCIEAASGVRDEEEEYNPFAEE